MLRGPTFHRRPARRLPLFQASPSAAAPASLVDLYSGLAPMGQSVLGVDAYKCRGPYTPDFSVKTPGGGVHWHPGARGHRLKGESAAFYFLAMLDDALQVQTMTRPLSSPYLAPV